jgi:aryl-alcohol dehydrogenase-like predicted oxidoreductase
MSALDLEPIELGTGTCQWGDRGAWGYGVRYGEGDVRSAFEASLDAGVDFFDTAELYGLGRSERLLGTFIRSARSPVRVATKFLPTFWRLRRTSLLAALRGSLRRLGLERVDLYQVHWPYPPISIETWMDALADAVQAGLASAVGVSNFDLDQTKRAADALAKRGLSLASNQVHYNLLTRRVETSGLMAYCRAHKIRVIAYSPLERGILSGKYGPDQLPSNRRFGAFRERQGLVKIQPLVDRLRSIARVRDRSPSQIALNWIISKGAMPIPGAKSARQLVENAGAKGWRLSDEEVASLDQISRNVAS